MKAKTVVDFFFPVITLMVAIIVDISCYQLIINHYNIFGFNYELGVSILVLIFFTLIPIIWIMIILFANEVEDES